MVLRDERGTRQRRGIWWPLLDEGLYLPDFLEYRWGKEIQKVAA